MGKISRIRRAKSARLRNSSAKSKLSDKRKLVRESDSSSTDTVHIDEQGKNSTNLSLYNPKIIAAVKREEQFVPKTPANVQISMAEEQL